MNGLRINQVAMVVRDIEKTIRHLSSLWDIGPFEIREMDVPDAILHGKQTRVRAKLAFAQVGPIELELIEPGEGENIYQEFLCAKGEGLHHLAIHVSDIESEVSRLKERGIDVLQSGKTPNVSFAYMDTESITGIIFELLQFKKNPV
jgi:methylmalonyl-CoA/ethylmalonyl-CoA epimerase